MSHNVLLIDDDTILSKGIAKLLEKNDFRVTLVHSGVEGLSLAVEENFDIILLDIEMPEFNGLEVLKGIRKQKSKNILPVIMVSSNEEVQDVVEALKLGANDYVSKPVNIEILNARVETQLEVRNLSLEFASKKELEGINALITTYNHEINNPLTISFGMMEKLKRDEEFSEKTYEKLKDSLERIRDIVQKIREATDDDCVDFQSYVKDTKMIKI